MKYNPKRNDSLVEVDGFKCIHPLQDKNTVEGLREIYFNLKKMIGSLLGFPYVDLTPAAGAHGELKGLLIARHYFLDKKDLSRNKVIVPVSAHGTNPATAAMAGFDVVTIDCDENGLIDMAHFEKEIDIDTAVVMITNPSTLGVFESNIEEIIKITHSKGALAYFDGANMNALMGYTNPGAMGFDIAHMNVHKTLSTPHGGGGLALAPLVSWISWVFICRKMNGTLMPLLTLFRSSCFMVIYLFC